ncbi:MAG: membrane protein insertase YidC [Candidatus Omnitrophota bacterium]
MEKRLILAIVLSSLVLLAWSVIAPKPEPAPLMAPAAVSSVAAPAQPIKAISDGEKPGPEVLTSFNNEKFEVIFNQSRAAIKEVIFKEYQSYKFPLLEGFANDLNFKKAEITSEAAAFKYADSDKEITKRFIFPKAKYCIELEITIKNLSSAPLVLSLPLSLGAIDFTMDPTHARNFDFTVSTQDKLLHPNPNKDIAYNNLKFIGLRDRYFCVITAPPTNNYSAFVKKTSSKGSVLGLNSPELTILPGQTTQQKFLIYLGPQEIKQIGQINPEWSGIVHFGTFDIISQILLKLLEIFYGLTRNWGMAIIILSIAVYFLLYPLSVKQMRSMKEMQALQPRIEELRKALKDNPQKLNKEIMELYREHKVNPLGGCLPLLLQMPIFFALYQALLRSVSLKGSGFLWIKDLSEPDKLFVLPTSLPILGNEVNLLPILMMIGMFVQQKLTMNTGAANNEQQKIMLIVFPLIFGFIFYHMPSGLVLYWFVNSALMLIFQFKVSRAK